MKTDMRVSVTKRMLREGFLRCIQAKPISKITVSELCRESGINRATFYNHYDSPVMILREIAYDYAKQLSIIYNSNLSKYDKEDNKALEKCLEYIAERKSEIKVLFSDHVENYLAGICMDIISEKVSDTVSSLNEPSDHYEESLLCVAMSASAVYGFIQIWLTKNIDKTPAELVTILKKVVQGNVFI